MRPSAWAILAYLIHKTLAQSDHCQSNSVDSQLTSTSLESFPSEASCKTYEIRLGDTCDSIAATHNLNLAELKSFNPSLTCSHIFDGATAGATICLSNPLGDYIIHSSQSEPGIHVPATVPDDVAPSTTTNCGLYHKVIGGDTCGTIQLRHSISYMDLLVLNPSLFAGQCDLTVGLTYCVAPVGKMPGSGDTPTSTFTITPESSASVPFVNPFIVKHKVTPMAEGTRTDCESYDLWREYGLSGRSTDERRCENFVEFYDLTVEELRLWNPSLNNLEADIEEKDVAHIPCNLQPSVSYCVALTGATRVPTPPVPPAPRASGEAAECVEWFKSNLDCESHLSHVHLTMARMYELNPSVGENCSSFVVGTYYCYRTADEDDDW